MGAVEVKRAYSRQPAASDGCKYVQDRIRAEKATVDQLWKKGARVYVCGSREVGEAVKQACLEMRMEHCARENIDGGGEEGAQKWFESIRNERYATDVFD